jgi:hypothetical protein
MPPAAGTRSGKETAPSMGDVINRLDRLEEIIRTLTAKVGDVDQQQLAFSVALIHLEQGRSADTLPLPPPVDQDQSAAAQQATSSSSSVVPPPPNNSNRGHHQAFPRRRAQETEDNLSGELFQMSHKIEFPKFDGTTDSLPWLNRCERYFCICGTPEHRRVHYASFYLLEDAQLWYHRLELNGGPPTSDQFVRLINKRFEPALTAIGELALLRKDGSVDDYAKKFMALSYCDPAPTETHQIQLFTAGLGTDLRTDVSLQQPAMLDDAVMFARAYEQRLLPQAVPQALPRSGRKFSRPTASVVGSPSSSAPASSVASVANKTTPTLKLSPAEIAD